MVRISFDWKHIQWNALSFLLKIVSSLIFNRLIAVYFGPEGLSLQAHLINLLNIMTAVARDGLSKGVIRLASTGNIGYLKMSVLVGMASAVLVGLLLWPVSWGLPAVFGQHEHLSGFFIILAVVYSAQYLFFSQWQGLLNFRLYAIGSTAGNLLGTIFLAVLFIFTDAPLEWALLCLPLGLALATLTTCPLWGNALFWLSPIKIADIYRQFGDVGMALGIMVFGVGAEYLARSWSMQQLGLAETGLWQAGASLSHYYTAAFLTVAIAVYFPRLSSCMINQGLLEARRYLRDTATWALPAIFLGLGGIYLCLDWVVALLFGPAFAEALPMVAIQLLADAFKLPNFLLYYWLLSQGRRRVFIGIQALSGILYLLGAYFLMPNWQGEAFPLARTLSNVGASIILLWAVFGNFPKKNAKKQDVA